MITPVYDLLSALRPKPARPKKKHPSMMSIGASMLNHAGWLENGINHAESAANATPIDSGSTMISIAILTQIDRMEPLLETDTPYGKQQKKCHRN